MNRARSREVAMEIMYQLEIHKAYDQITMASLLSHYEEILDLDYVNGLVNKWIENRETVESKISEHLKGWKIERLARIDLAILRLGVTEMLYVENVPNKVSVNEAVNLAKKYVDEKSGKFVNGVLSHFVENK
ncbi:transcription antitermination factor NusB [Fusibacter tunisiensis]|uniref:Transcription antitermination protein NusB n=1 Tax=Fusibacter tunisiensis TaxID=1008308 RepID=A0ABS2MQ94_9FIRM|nr:transcription antitermination factor NusB [Fusibacter tunisiensis]MBM7561568.1 N utilization substance protein B [Fusibacter tunisiensis]